MSAAQYGQPHGSEAEFIANGLKGKRSGNGFTARCPAHADSTASLSISQSGDRVLLKCHAGCEQEAVIQGLRDRGLWVPKGVTKFPSQAKDIHYVYNDEQGRPLHRTTRTPDKKFPQSHWDGRRWVLGLCPRVVLYHLDELVRRNTETVHFAEGEKDCDRLRSQGKLSTTNPMGAGKKPGEKWRSGYTETLSGRDVVMFYDNDTTANGFQGQEHAKNVSLALLGAGCQVRIVDLPEGKGKDVSDYLDYGHTKADLDKLIDAAPYYNEEGVIAWRAKWGSSTAKQPNQSSQPAKPSDEQWKASLILTEKGTPKALLANALIAFRQAPVWKGVLGYDEFSLKTMLLAKTPWGGAPGEWGDNEDRLATEWLQCAGICVGVEIAAQAVQTVAQENSFHPVRRYLEELCWDDTPRVDTWLHDYLGVADSDYSRAVGKRWLISGVARIFQPGVKADACLTIEGAQGIGKSRALKVLGGKWFTDEMADFGSKDASMQLQGAWLIELGELDALNRSEVSRIKAFMSRPTDRYRPAYGRRIVESPRQCIFAGSVNHNSYLRDETGGRRFWPVECGVIRLQELKDARDQLWAEAVHCYRAGQSWWLDSTELVTKATEEQADRLEGDPWDNVIATWVEDRQDASLDQILGTCLDKKASDWTRSDKVRVAKILRSLQWERYKARVGDTREWRYRRVSQ